MRLVLSGKARASERYSRSPVSFVPSTGLVGSQVMIHGAHFVGTTAVKFNGVSAKFQVLNTGNIKATVPAGATTGPIEVINQGGETTTSKTFTVSQ
jgi:large repetitive protein